MDLHILALKDLLKADNTEKRIKCIFVCHEL